MKRIISFDSTELVNGQLEVLIQSTLIFKGWHCDISPWDIRNRGISGKRNMSILIDNYTAKITLLSYENISSYATEGYKLQFLPNYLDFLKVLSEDLKYYN